MNVVGFSLKIKMVEPSWKDNSGRREEEPDGHNKSRQE